MDPGVHAPAETRQCQCNASWGGLSCQGPAAARAALVGTAGAPPLICKGINLPVTLGRVWPPLCCLSHGASWLLCPPCHPAQPTLSPAALRAPEEGRHCRVPPPHQPFLASIWITFFTRFIYEDSPPSANTQSFLSLRSGRPVSLFYSYYFSLFPLQGPRLGSLAPRQPGRQRVPAGARLCLATGADGESSRRWDVQPFFLPQPPRGTQVCLRLPRLSPQLGCGPSG